MKQKEAGYTTAVAFLSLNYKAQHDYPNALFFARKAQTLNQQARREGRPPDNRIELAGPMNMAEIFEQMNQLDSALHYIQISYRALFYDPPQLSRATFDWQIRWIYGKIEHRCANDGHALALFRTALASAQKIDYAIGNQEVSLSLAHYFDAHHQADSAIAYAIRAFVSAVRTRNYPVVSAAGFLLKTHYAARHQPALALWYFELAQAASDSATSAEKTRRLQAFVAQEERKQQIAEARQLARESRLKQLALLVGLALSAVFILFLARINRQKQRLTQLLATQKTAIETFNLDLEAKIQARTAELQQALTDVQTAFDKGQTTERKRVSSDLHDEMGAALSTIALFSDLTKRKAETAAPQLVDELERISAKSRTMVQTMRDTVWMLSNYDAQNLWERMHQYGQEFLPVNGISLDWRVPENAPSASFVVKKNVLLAYKEALNNTVKHANATHVSVQLTHATPNAFTLKITDNGTGFDPTAARQQGNGLRNFEGRMAELGGTLCVDSAVGQGTTLTFCWTMSNELSN